MIKTNMRIGPTSHQAMLDTLNRELIEDFGFEPQQVRERPVTFDVVRTLIDRGESLETWSFAYYQTGNREFIPLEVQMAELPRVDGKVDDDALELMGIVTASQHVEVELDPEPIPDSGVEILHSN